MRTAISPANLSFIFITHEEIGSDKHTTCKRTLSHTQRHVNIIKVHFVSRKLRNPETDTFPKRNLRRKIIQTVFKPKIRAKVREGF